MKKLDAFRFMPDVGIPLRIQVITITYKSISHEIFCQQLPLLSPSLRKPLPIDCKEAAPINHRRKNHTNLRTTPVPASSFSPCHATLRRPLCYEHMQKCTNEVVRKYHAPKAKKSKSMPVKSRRMKFLVHFPTLDDGQRKRCVFRMQQL